MKVTLLQFCTFSLVLSLFLPDTKVVAQTGQYRWYKGNTHAHTVICGHADNSPAEVAAWYHDHGYHFLILSEHNHFIHPDTVPLPADKRDDFILVPGEEVTGAKDVHTTALNPTGFVHPGHLHSSTTAVLQEHVDSTLKMEGIPILNHPNWRRGMHAHEILPVRNLHLFELYNGHPDVRNWGEAGVHPSTEQKWDSLLSAGMLVYGLSSDDAHIFDTLASHHSNPGRGWVMVRSNTLNAEAITEAISKGDFYASNGVILKLVETDERSYQLEVDVPATQRELRSELLMGKFEKKARSGFQIYFIGKNGKVLRRRRGLSASYKFKKKDQYVRAKVVFSKKLEGGYESFYAWTQPIFVKN